MLPAGHGSAEAAQAVPQGFQLQQALDQGLLLQVGLLEAHCRALFKQIAHAAVLADLRLAFLMEVLNWKLPAASATRVI